MILQAFTFAERASQRGKSTIAKGDDERALSAIAACRSSLINSPQDAFRKSSSSLSAQAKIGQMMHDETLTFQSQEQLQSFYNQRLEHFLSNFREIISAMATRQGGASMREGEVSGLLSHVDALVQKVRENGVSVQIGDTHEYHYDTKQISVRYYGQMQRTAIDSILLHELFHAFQDAAGINLYGLEVSNRSIVEGTASMFSASALGFFYEGLGRSDIPDSYGSYFSYYLIDRASGGRLLAEVLNGAREGELSQIYSSAAQALGVSGQLLKKVQESSQFDRLNAFAITDALGSNAKQWLDTFESDNPLARREHFSFSDNFNQQFDTYVYSMGVSENREADWLRMAVQCFRSSLSLGVSSLQFPNDGKLRDDEVAVHSYLFLKKRLGGSRNADALALLDLLKLQFDPILLSDRMRGIFVEQNSKKWEQSRPYLDASSGAPTKYFAEFGKKPVNILLSFDSAPIHDLEFTPVGISSKGMMITTEMAAAPQASMRSKAASFFPSPTAAPQINLDFPIPAGAQFVQVQIYDSAGRKVSDQTLEASGNRYRIGIENLASGAYFAKIHSLDATGHELSSADAKFMRLK